MRQAQEPIPADRFAPDPMEPPLTQPLRDAPWRRAGYSITMPFRIRRARRVTTHQTTASRRAGRSLVLACLYFGLTQTAGADELAREWAVGIPEPIEYQETEPAAGAFCPLGVCQPRSRDSLWAITAFGIAAAASAYLGKKRQKKSHTLQTETELP